MGFPIVGVVIATILLFVYWNIQKRNRKNHGLKELPGPRGLPIVGNMLQLGSNPTPAFCKWSEEYGEIYQVKLAQNTVIVVSDPKWSKELFSNDPVFTGKPHFEAFDLYEDIPHIGVFQSESELWEVQRRFLLRQLRDFGFGKSAMESLIIDEVNDVLETFKSKKNKPIGRIRETLRLAVVNALWTILTSKRFKHNDPKLQRIAANTTDTFNEVFAQGGLLIFMPWLRHIIPKLSGYTAIREMLNENKDLFETEVKAHKANARDEDLRDFIDVYLAEMRKQTDPNNVFYGEMAEKHLVSTLFDLFIAGNDTTATTISWTILYLSKFQNAQKKLQQEISEITGDVRKVSVDDRPNMPYTLALIDEVLRFSSIVPDGVQHRALADREFKGYHIPKDAWIQPNLYYIHHNKKLWGDPENFRPERFLSPNGKKYVKSENVQAFQIGRRQCVGETLARDSIFLYVTNIFQQFSIGFDPASPEPTFEAGIGFLRAPLPYSVIMKERLAK